MAPLFVLGLLFFATTKHRFLGVAFYHVIRTSLSEVNKPASVCRIIIVIRCDNLPLTYRSISLTRFPCMFST